RLQAVPGSGTREQGDVVDVIGDEAVLLGQDLALVSGSVHDDQAIGGGHGGEVPAGIVHDAVDAEDTRVLHVDGASRGEIHDVESAIEIADPELARPIDRQRCDVAV